MNMREKRYLEPGDLVYWCSPDSGGKAEECTLKNILTPSGFLEEPTDVLEVQRGNGEIVELYASELQ